MTTKEQRAHWRALEQAAMPDWNYDEELCNITGMSKSGARFPMGFSYCQTFTDFTLAARTAVPALLDDVARLEAELAALKQAAAQVAPMTKLGIRIYNSLTPSQIALMQRMPVGSGDHGLQGKTMSDRNPRINPQPGDVLRKGEREIVVHFVERGQVYFGNTETLGGGRITIEGFREDAKDAEVLEVISADKA